MNIVTPKSWKELKNEKDVYFQIVTSNEEHVLKAYKIGKRFEQEEGAILELMDVLNEKEEITNGFLILEENTLILNSFKKKDLTSTIYSVGNNLMETFQINNFEFEGIRKRIVDHEKKAWADYQHQHKDKLVYLNDIFIN